MLYNYSTMVQSSKKSSRAQNYHDTVEIYQACLNISLFWMDSSFFIPYSYALSLKYYTQHLKKIHNIRLKWSRSKHEKRSQAKRPNGNLGSL